MILFQSETLGELHLRALQKEHQQKLEEQARYTGNKRTQKLKNLFLEPTGIKPLIILIGLFFFQQFSGIYITLFYAVTFIQVRNQQLKHKPLLKFLLSFRKLAARSMPTLRPF